MIENSSIVYFCFAVTILLFRMFSTVPHFLSFVLSVDLSSILYMSLSGSGGVYAFFKDNLGETSNVLLPGFPSSANYGCGEYIMTAKDEMWIFFGTGPLTAVQYKFSGSPLPTVAMLVSSK